MSFYLSGSNTLKPGPVRNAGAGSICERVVIETTKVFDACISQTREIGVPLTVTAYDPENPTVPLTFISAECNSSGITVSNVVIDRLIERPNFANVSADITVPVTITYRDSAGIIGTATSSLTLSRSAVLFVPQSALTPVNVTALVACVSTKGSYTSTDLFTVDFCINVILKITAVVDILIPSYGYAQIPTCTDVSPVCPGLQSSSIFPTATLS